MRIFLTGTVAIAFAATPNPAFSDSLSNQVMCADHRELLSDFKESHREERGAVAVTDSGQLLEVLVSPKGTWTMLVTQPHGPSCVVATGQSWEQKEPGDFGIDYKNDRMPNPGYGK